MGCHFLFKDLPNPGIKSSSLCISCIGRWITLPLHHLEMVVTYSKCSHTSKSPSLNWAKCFQVSFMLEHESVRHCSLWLNYIPSCGCTFNLSIQQRLDISTVSTLGLLRTMLLWTFIYKFQVVICFQFKLSILKYREGNGTPLQYSCLENPMDRGAWKAAVHGVTEGRTRLSNFIFMHWRRKW